MAAGIGHALRMVASAGTDEMLLAGVAHTDLAHRVERPAQLVAAHRRQVFPLQEYLGAMAVGQVIVALQRRLGEEIAQRKGGLAGVVGKLGHARGMTRSAAGIKSHQRPPLDIMAVKRGQDGKGEDRRQAL